VEQLRREVADLAARVKQNSKNSSRPPSSDGLGKPTGSHCGRGPAASPVDRGAAGRHDEPDRSSRSRDPARAGLLRQVRGPGRSAGNRDGTAAGDGDPPVKAEVTEHQMIERACSGCRARTRAQAPDGVNAPVQ
jgi:transposase